jgi:hypothetical protein
MKYLFAILALLMALFAAVQVNDPDGPLWMLLYGVPAIWAGIAWLRPRLLAGTGSARAAVRLPDGGPRAGRGAVAAGGGMVAHRGVVGERGLARGHGAHADRRRASGGALAQPVAARPQNGNPSLTRWTRSRLTSSFCRLAPTVLGAGPPYSRDHKRHHSWEDSRNATEVLCLHARPGGGPACLHRNEPGRRSDQARALCDRTQLTLAMVQPPGDSRKFVIEQFGRVRIIDENGELQGQPFLDIRHKIVTCGRTSTSAGCSAWRSIPISRRTASSTLPIARR